MHKLKTINAESDLWGTYKAQKRLPEPQFRLSQFWTQFLDLAYLTLHMSASHGFMFYLALEPGNAKTLVS